MAQLGEARQAVAHGRWAVPLSVVWGGVLLLAAALMLVDLALIFFWVPTDANLGIVQRVFYFHVPSAIMGFVAFFVVFVASLLYIRRRDRRWDALAHAAAEIGVVFTTLVLLTGIIWAKPIWGVWWTWEPRLTTTLILWLIYVAYLMVRSYAGSPAQAARYSAVVGIVGFIDVPIVYFSVVWWRTIHPQPVFGPIAEPDSLPPAMLFTLLFSLATFAVLFAYLVAQRYALRQAEDTLEQARRGMDAP